VCGLKTAYIERPREYGHAQPKDVSPHPENNLHARDINELAGQLGC
jgi:2-haloacid dehalogenase